MKPLVLEILLYRQKTLWNHSNYIKRHVHVLMVENIPSPHVLLMRNVDTQIIIIILIKSNNLCICIVFIFLLYRVFFFIYLCLKCFIDFDIYFLFIYIILTYLYIHIIFIFFVSCCLMVLINRLD